jgi:hypothetical protein
MLFEVLKNCSYIDQTQQKVLKNMKDKQSPSKQKDVEEKVDKPSSNRQMKSQQK